MGKIEWQVPKKVSREGKMEKNEQESSQGIYDEIVTGMREWRIAHRLRAKEEAPIQDSGSSALPR